jgi:hypothetical protein
MFTYTIFITNLLHNVFIVINYCSDMFRPMLSVTFRDFANLSTCAAYMSAYVGQTPHISVQIQLKLNQNIKIFKVSLSLITT